MAYERDTDATDAGQFGGRHSLSARSGVVSNLDDVFDDPAHGEIGRDRLGVHFAWEGVLFLAVIAFGYLLFANYREATTGVGLRALLVFFVALGTLALAASLSLRVSAVNLALGPVAIASGLYYAQNSDGGLLKTSMWPLLWALVLGAGIALLVVGFHVPGWAGSLAGAMVAIAWIENKFANPVTILGEFNPLDQAYYLVGGLIVLSAMGGMLGAVKSIRRGVGRFRSIGDPASRRGGLAANVAALGLVVSTLLASVAGIILAALLGATNQQVTPESGLEWTALAVGAALVGGTSAFGRRGGVFGTVLASGLLAILITYGDRADWRISDWVLGAGAIVVGLIVTRLVETFGRPLTIDEADDWSDVGVAPASSWSAGGGGADAWSSLASQSTSASTTTSQWGAETDRWR